MPNLVHISSLQKAEQTKQLLVETAYRLFKERGYEQVGIRDIVSEMELTTGAFYYHFKSKADILNYRARQNDRWICENVPELLKDEAPLVKLEQLFSVYLCKILTEDGYELSESRMFARYYEKRESDVLKEVGMRFVREAQAQGSLDGDISPEEITRRLLVTSRGVEYDWCIHKGAYDVGAEMSAYIRMVLQYYG